MKTLQILHKNWIPKLEVAGLIVAVGGLLVSFALAFLKVLDLATGVGIAFSSGFALGIAHDYCIYNFVQCPSCGENLALFKNGKKMPIKQLYNGLSIGKPCRHCGWDPSEKSSI